MAAKYKMPSRSLTMQIFIVGALLVAVGLPTSVSAQNTFSLDLQNRPDMICTNLASGVTCTNPPPYAMNTAGYSDSHRNIISYDTDGIYALGFDQVTSGSFYLSIYIWNPSDNSAGVPIWRAKALTGSSAVVDENATMSFLSNGSIDLKTSDGTLIWTTGTENAGAVSMQFDLDVGNLKLFHSTGAVVWQSIDN